MYICIYIYIYIYIHICIHTSDSIPRSVRQRAHTHTHTPRPLIYFSNSFHFLFFLKTIYISYSISFSFFIHTLTIVLYYIVHYSCIFLHYVISYYNITCYYSFPRRCENMVGVKMVLAEFIKFKHGLYKSFDIECFEGIMLESCLLQPCFHVAGTLSCQSIHMRNVLGWLGTRLAQITLNYIKLA